MSGYYSLAEAIAHLESVSVKAQEVLHNIILETMYRKKSAACFSDCFAELDELANVGLAVQVDDPEAAMRFLGHHNLVKRLCDKGISGFKKNCSLDALVLWLTLSSDVDISSLVVDIKSFVYSPSLDKVKKKVYIYLGRKLINEHYYDVDTGKYIDYPKGATFSTTVSLVEGVGGLTCEFPDDEITDLLDKYGCNRCRNWHP